MEDGSIIEGEHLITESPKKIKKVYYNGRPKASDEALKAIHSADLIVLSMGSLFTSIIPNLIFKDLEPKGAGFRNGFGVSGRLANFLDKNPSRIQEAFGILLSLPGIPIVYYGDEVGVTNNFEYAKKSAQNRKNKNKFLKILSFFDSRDINRGNVPKKLFYGSTKGYYKFNSKIYNITKNLINVRKNNSALINGDIEILKTKSTHNLAYIRKNKEQQILVINNLSKDKLIAEITLPLNIIIKKQGKITHMKNLVNRDVVKVNISTTNRTMHLRLAPYQIVWLEL
jgi:maltose alpha-D-glucosyltransferase/alpha-amylase